MTSQAIARFTEAEQTILEQMGYAHIPERHTAAFLYTAATLGLDPRLGEISLIERRSQQGQTYTVQVGISGYRKAARRIATEQGVTIQESEPEFCGEDGVWKPMWLQKWGPHPEAARVTVTRGEESFSVVVTWDEFAQLKRDGQPMALWASKPAYMLAKTAASLAYRRAFPDFNGTYEEGERFDAPAHTDTPAPARAQDTPAAVPVLDGEVVEGNSPQELIAAAAEATSLDDVRALWQLAGGNTTVQAALTERAEQLKAGV